MILVIIGIVPMIIVEKGIVESYEERAVAVRSITVKNQCDIICDQMVQQNYLEDQSSEAINSELNILNNIYGGRIMIIDENFRIVKDTYDLDRGKTMVSQEVIDSYNGKDTSRYDSKSSYIEMTIRIQDKETKETLGVMLMSVSTDEIQANMNILEQKGTMILMIVMVLVLVLGYFLSGILVRPFQKVTRSIENLTDGYLDEDISVPDYLETELITNVSHDIKTPLTSIINYVDILKRSDIADEKIRGYLDILEAKAQRLKTLTEDVVEASKVSSGNITLECMDMNLTELVQQTEGEFAEKFEARGLTMVVNLPEEPAVVHVDGRRMWRVLENIFGNAAKYAMPGTRVYADLTVSGNHVNFSLKNVSEQQLNISADELTERFIRGDLSRSTEGSGLGLSIAKSLTEMQGGRFELYLDGDLFRVNICFERVR